MQTQIILKRVIEEEIEGEKPLRCQAEIDPLDNQLEYKGEQETFQA